MACFSNAVRLSPEYKRGHRSYFEFCARWWAELTPDQRDAAQIVIDCYAGPHRDAAESVAAGLPSAPKRPLLARDGARKRRVVRPIEVAGAIERAQPWMDTPARRPKL